MEQKKRFRCELSQLQVAARRLRPVAWGSELKKLVEAIQEPLQWTDVLLFPVMLIVLVLQLFRNSSNFEFLRILNPIRALDRFNPKNKKKKTVLEDQNESKVYQDFGVDSVIVKSLGSFILNIVLKVYLRLAPIVSAAYVRCRPFGAFIAVKISTTFNLCAY